MFNCCKTKLKKDFFFFFEEIYFFNKIYIICRKNVFILKNLFTEKTFFTEKNINENVETWEMYFYGENVCVANKI